MSNSIFNMPLSTVELQAIFANQQAANMAGTLSFLKSFLKQQMDAFWIADSLTVQQHMDAFGTEAAALFQAAAALGQFIVAWDSTYTPPQPSDYGHTYTINQDGSVTVTS